jgi:uncharacterized surface protein with fasciclin (FAS1) repeats
MRTCSFRPLLALALVSLLALAACKKKDNSPQSIAEVVADDGRFTVLNAAINKAGLASALGQGALTLFAPTDAAFKAAGIDAGTLNSATPSALTAILQYHVLPTRTPSAGIPAAENTEVTTLNGAKLYVSKKSGAVSANGARVTQADVEAPNGVIHVVDRVLLPPTGTLTQVASANADLSLMVAAVNRIAQKYPTVAAGLAGPGPLTVFAPSNQAFQAAGLGTPAAINAFPEADLVKILTYHILPTRTFSPLLTSGDVATFQGGNLTVTVSAVGVTVKGAGNASAAAVTQPDLVATNAVIHVVDRVLVP